MVLTTVRVRVDGPDTRLSRLLSCGHGLVRLCVCPRPSSASGVVPPRSGLAPPRPRSVASRHVTYPVRAGRGSGTVSILVTYQQRRGSATVARKRSERRAEPALRPRRRWARRLMATLHLLIFIRISHRAGMCYGWKDADCRTWTYCDIRSAMAETHESRLQRLVTTYDRCFYNQTEF